MPIWYCSTGREDFSAVVELSDPVLDVAAGILSYRVEAVRIGITHRAGLRLRHSPPVIDTLRGDEM